MTELNDIERAADDLATVAGEVAKVIVGQKDLIDAILMCLIADGHLLIEGAPGLAKTRTVRTFSEAVGGVWQRIQFTPDLVPADLVGTRVWRPDRSEFDTELGPVMANFVLADEVNRAAPKVQSALLESMEERQVTIGGKTFPLPRPFLVMGTQNSVESEGTYPLPEAQTDRFLIKVDVTYPTPAEELEVVRRSLVDTDPVSAVIDSERVIQLQNIRRNISVSRTIATYAVSLVNASRELVGGGYVAYGAGPRGSLALVRVAQARALLSGRRAVTVDDIASAAPLVLAHRLCMTFDAVRKQISAASIVDEIVASVPRPSAGA
jgi:MoxR-like ATPase